MKHVTKILLPILCVGLFCIAPSVFADDDDDSAKVIDSLVDDLMKDVGSNMKLSKRADSLRFNNPHPTAADTAEFVGIYRQLADGLPWAAYQMGDVYLLGWSVSVDTAEAVRWYMKSADMGDTRGMRSTGVAKLNGIGIPVDIAGGLDWLAKSADAGNLEASAYLGELYFLGDKFTGQNDSLAVVYLGKASDSGNIESTKHLADIFYDTQSRYYNDSIAFVFANYLDSKGIAKYEARTGYMYLWGYGVPESPDDAGTHLYKAAIQNNSLAEAQLAYMYYAGIGAKVDYVQSYAWALRAQKHGDDEFAPLLFDSLNVQLTKAQQDSAGSIEAEWHPFTAADARYEEVKKLREEQRKSGKSRPGSTGSTRGAGRGAAADTASAAASDTTKTQTTTTTGRRGRRP